MSSLEASVTLEDVFAVVEAKRVPLAPELAGYLSLEVADGTDASGGAVDPRTVYISEEGTVALVRPKRDAGAGDAETSVRNILAKLLEASGSVTPALSASARRASGAGLPALVGELEAALIPVNRAAGRRALARLAREVKRVTLGVGRNASMPPPAKPMAREPLGRPFRESPEDVMSGPDAPPGPRGSFADDGGQQLSELMAQMGVPSIIGMPGGPAPAPSPGLTPPPLPSGHVGPPALPNSREARDARALPAPPPPPARPLPPPPMRSPGPPVAAPPPRGKSLPAAASGSANANEPRPLPDKLFGGDEVDSLLSTFEVSSVGEKQMRTELKAIAGLGPTPGPPDARTLAELTKDVGRGLPKREGDSVEALLALSDVDASAPLGAPPPRADAGPLARPLPPPGFGARAEDNGALAPFGGSALSAPSPLAPMTAGRAIGAPPPGVRYSPVPQAPAGGRTLPVPGGPGAPGAPAPGAVPGRREKLSEAPAPLPAPATGPRRKTTGNRTGGNFRQARAPRTGLAMLLLTLFVLAGGGVAVWTFKPAFFTGKKKPIPTATVSATPPPAPRCKVALVVTDVTPNAEILLRMGQAPLDVERMPVGTRLEFVAMAEGQAPRRAVIKSESPWDKTPDGKPRIDVPIQLDPSKAKPGALDPWPPAEPPGQVGGLGAPGTVHVVSNVRGAEVWLLAGLGPEARIEQLRCDGDIDVLLAGPPQLRKRLHVGEKEIQAAAPDAQGNRVVSVSAK